MEAALGQRRFAPQIEVDEECIQSYIDGRSIFEEIFPFDADDIPLGSDFIDTMALEISAVESVDPTITVEQKWFEWAAGAGGIELAAHAIRERVPPVTGDTTQAVVARYAALAASPLFQFVNIAAKGLLTSAHEFWTGIDDRADQNWDSLNVGVMAEVTIFYFEIIYVSF